MDKLKWFMHDCFSHFFWPSLMVTAVIAINKMTLWPPPSIMPHRYCDTNAIKLIMEQQCWLQSTKSLPHGQIDGKRTLSWNGEQMAPCGWYRPSLIWASMLCETEPVTDWRLSGPLVGWFLALHTTGCRPCVCVVTACWKNHY